MTGLLRNRLRRQCLIPLTGHACPNEFQLCARRDGGGPRIPARAAKRFLAQSATQRLTQLANDLEIAVANASATESPRFRWRTGERGPIRTTLSRNWKGTTNDFAPIFAEISVDYACTLLPEVGRVCVDEGVTVVRIKQEFDPDPSEKVFHFDAGAGGWENRAGHPPLHFQFHGFVKDVPRLPSLIVHPLDVIDFLAILEPPPEGLARGSARVEKFAQCCANFRNGSADGFIQLQPDGPTH